MNENKAEGSFMEEHALGGTQLAHDAEKGQPHALRRAGIWAQPSTDCSDTSHRVTQVTIGSQSMGRAVGWEPGGTRQGASDLRVVTVCLSVVALQHEDMEMRCANPKYQLRARGLQDTATVPSAIGNLKKCQVEQTSSVSCPWLR